MCRDNGLPRWSLEEPVPEGSGSGAASIIELERMLDEYYRAGGWTVHTGLPKKEKLKEPGLDE